MEPEPAPEPAVPAPPAQKRDEWMVEPTADFIDYTQKGYKKTPPPKAVTKDYRPIIHKNELNQQLRDGKSLDEYATDENPAAAVGEVTYTFGDQGSQWRMTRLKRTYEAAQEKGVTVEEIAEERYGDLKRFDDAREEEMELGRRETYGMDRRDAKEKPTGELYAERVRNQDTVDRRRDERLAVEEKERERIAAAAPPPKPVAPVLDQTALNRMQAQLMKAQLRGDPKAVGLEEEYNAAVEASRKAASNDNVVVLSAMDNRQLAGLEGRVGREVVQGKRGKLVENEDMTIDDMLREEKITRGQGAGRQMAERISRDAKFDVSGLDEFQSFPTTNALYRTTLTTWTKTQPSLQNAFKRARSISKTWPSVNSRRCRRCWIHVPCASKTKSRRLLRSYLWQHGYS